VIVAAWFECGEEQRGFAGRLGQGASVEREGGSWHASGLTVG
jgi:hypothetical protein